MIVKHANPCGVASGASLVEAYEAAFACDTVSAFGGIIAVNRPIDAAAAEAMTGIFTEVVIAPDADEAARAIFAAQEESAPAADRRASRSVTAGPDAEDDRRRICWCRRATMAGSRAISSRW